MVKTKKIRKVVVLLVLFQIFTLSVHTQGVLANTIESSTIHFEGTLTENNGVFTGTIDATAGTYYVPGGPGTVYDPVDARYETPDGREAVGGFDVYAAMGENAYYDDSVQGVIGSDHDGYSSSGGWGDFWDPDVPDWEHYQLTLTESKWYLEYKGSALGTPMSGVMHWDKMCGEETDVGQYRGTVPSDPDANDGDAALNGGGAQAWDMDWTWGSEVIPLEYPGFKVSITEVDNGIYHVTLTPCDCLRKPVGGEVEPVNDSALLKTPILLLASLTIIIMASSKHF